MIARCVCVLGLCLSVSLVGLVAEPLALKAGVGTLFTIGSATEQVFKAKRSDANGNDLLSLLSYPTPPSIGAWVDLSLVLDPLFEIRLAADAAWALTTGKLTDDDWIDISSTNSPNVHSDSIALQTALVNGRLEFVFPLRTGNWVFTPMIGVALRHGSWEGWDVAEVNYTTNPATKIALYGQIYDFRQFAFIPHIGMEARWKLPGIQLYALTRFSPFVMIEARDIRFRNSKTYLGTPNGGFMVQPTLGSLIELGNGFGLDILVEYRILKDARGNVLKVTDADGDKGTSRSVDADKAGAGFESFSLSVGLRFY